MDPSLAMHTDWLSSGLKALDTPSRLCTWKYEDVKYLRFFAQVMFMVEKIEKCYTWIKERVSDAVDSLKAYKEDLLMRVRGVPDRRYIEKALESEQVGIIVTALKGKDLDLKPLKQSALALEDEETGESGIRVDLLYKAISNAGDEYAANIQAFFEQQGDQETVGYLRSGNVLLKEYYTNDQIFQSAEKYQVIDWDGEAILGQREFEKENLLE